MAKQTFTLGQVLTAAQVTALQTNEYNQTVSVKTASYTLVAADVGTRIEMNSGSATTVTVNTALFAAGDTLVIQNKGAGVSTVTAGTATVSTSGSLALAQYDQGTLYFVSTGVAIFFNATAGAADIPKSLLTTNGDMIYATGASTPVRLGIGSSAQVLTVAGGIPSWATPAANASGLTFISKTTFSGVASQSINSVFTSTYSNYKILVTLTSHTVSDYIRIRMRASGTDYTTGSYYWGNGYIITNSPTITGENGNAATSFNIGFQESTAADAAITFDLFNPQETRLTNYYGFSGRQATSGVGALQFMGGSMSVTNAFDGLTIYGASGNISGEVTIYGYQKS